MTCYVYYKPKHPKDTIFSFWTWNRCNRWNIFMAFYLPYGCNTIFFKITNNWWESYYNEPNIRLISKHICIISVVVNFLNVSLLNFLKQLYKNAPNFKTHKVEKLSSGKTWKIILHCIWSTLKVSAPWTMHINVFCPFPILRVKVSPLMGRGQSFAVLFYLAMCNKLCSVILCALWYDIVFCFRMLFCTDEPYTVFLWTNKNITWSVFIDLFCNNNNKSDILGKWANSKWKLWHLKL